MPKTGSHLRIKPFGDNVLGVTLEGDPKRPEPISFCVKYPGGEVDIERCTDGSYWVHLIVNQKENVIRREGPDSGAIYGRFSEARMHSTNKHTSKANLGDFANPGLYDVALHVERTE